MSHYLLTYVLADDYMDRRPRFRDQHLRHAWQASRDGGLVLGGTVGDPVSSALILFRSAESAADFARADPYVTSGLVSRWSIDPWNTVVGDSAANPVKPAD